MIELDRQYPQYRFARHKGYPTKEHYERIGQYGISPVHRISFLKNLDDHLKGRTPMTTREIGTKGESFAAQVLQKNGAEILSRNYYTPYGEIDLIVRDGNCIAFVEVKTRGQDHNPACRSGGSA